MISYITYIDLNDVDSFFADATGVEDKQRAAQWVYSFEFSLFSSPDIDVHETFVEEYYP